MVKKRRPLSLILLVTGLIGLPLLGFTILRAGDLAAQAVPPAPTPAGSSLDQRVAQRKTERAIVLDERATKKLESSCVGSQTKFRSIQNEILDIEKSREEVYRAIEGKVWVAIGRLKVAGKDTFNLETSQLDYTKKTTKFLETFNQFKQAIDDILIINCASDPTAFMAYVETIRLLHEDIAAQAPVINKHLVDNLRPLISQYSEEL